MSIINSQPLVGASGQSTGGYTIAKSVRLRASATAYLNRTTTTPTSAYKFTYSGWIKRGTLSGYQELLWIGQGPIGSANYIQFYFDTSANSFNAGATYSSVNALGIGTNAVYRDTSAWYHFVITVDTTQATAANRILFYVNGISQLTTTSFAIAQNTAVQVSGYTMQLGSAIYSSTQVNNFDGYMAEVNFIDGQALTPSSFGETDSVTGVWKPKAYSGTYGTNGFYLKFTDVATTSGSNAGLGKDFSGNGNYWTTNNISVTSGSTYDSMTDVPTLTSATAANYAVLNPISNIGNGTISAGNLNYVATSAAWMSCAGTIFPSSGKWYFEVTLEQFNSSFMLGVCSSSFSSWGTYAGASAVAWALQGTSSGTGNWNNNSSGTLAAGEAAATNDKYMVAYDIDAGKLWFGKNGTWYASGNPSAGTNPVYTSVTGSLAPVLSSNTTTDKLALNCGQRPFAYTPPTGFKALNTYNLPDSTIVAGNKVMDATTYTGAGGTTSFTNTAGFKPDLVWIKGRSNTGSHSIQDSVRGAGSATKLSSNSTNAENNNVGDATDPIYGYLSAFNSNGFTVVNGSTGGQTNSSGVSFVGWQWQAGQGTTSSNTSGSITSTVSVNASAGFSIVTYTGNGATPSATIGHGLGVAPQFVIVKPRVATGVSDNWQVGCTAIGWDKFLELNSTFGTTTISNRWNNTAPTSSVVTLGDVLTVSGKTYVAYCWAEIAGFSKFGSYTGNGSTDGPFIYTGFRTKFLLVKCSSSAFAWFVWDTTRSTFNVIGDFLKPNSSDAEILSSSAYIDVLSNGFKMRNSDVGINGSGSTYIFMAFAENPFKNSLAR